MSHWQMDSPDRLHGTVNQLYLISPSLSHQLLSDQSGFSVIKWHRRADILRGKKKTGPVRFPHFYCFLSYQRRKHSSSVKTDDRVRLLELLWLTCLLGFPQLLQSDQTPQTELLVALHLETPTQPSWEWDTSTMKPLPAAV